MFMLTQHPKFILHEIHRKSVGLTNEMYPSQKNFPFFNLVLSFPHHYLMILILQQLKILYGLYPHKTYYLLSTFHQTDLMKLFGSSPLHTGLHLQIHLNLHHRHTGLQLRIHLDLHPVLRFVLLVYDCLKTCKSPMWACILWICVNDYLFDGQYCNITVNAIKELN